MTENATFTPPTNARPSPDQPPTKVRRSATTSDPVRARHKATTSRGLRVRDLFLAFMNRIGDPTDPIAQSAALTAAELTFACEAVRARVLDDAGDAALADALVRVSNLLDRAERKLAKFKVSKKPQAALAEHLARRSAEKESAA